MPVIKGTSLRWIIGLCPMLAAHAFGAPADSVAEGSKTNLPTLKAEARLEAGPGLTTAYRVFATFGTNRYAFLLPAGFRFQDSDARSFTLVAEDSSCILAFRVAPATPRELPELQPQDFRQAVLSEYPGITILDEFALSADNRAGPAFEGVWSTTSGLSRRIRAVFIPSRETVLAFSLRCNPEKIEAGRRALNTVLLTFRASDRNGKLFVPPLSDRL